jgi:hypothetical protein
VRFVRADLALDKPLVFPKAKDRPVVITALASRSVWLLTLDEGDFHTKLGREVYGLRIATPGEFLIEQRAQGVLLLPTMLLRCWLTVGFAGRVNRGGGRKGGRKASR